MLKKVICLLLVLAFSAALFACASSEGSTVDNGEKPDDSISAPADKDGNKTPADSQPTDKELVDSNGTVDLSKEITFFANVNKSNPNVIVTKTSDSHSKLGACEGYFVTTIYGENDYTFYYDYSKFNKIGEGDRIEKIPADTVICKDGEYRLASTGEIVTAVPDQLVMNVMLNISKEYLGSYTINETADKLTTKVTAAQAENIFGVKIAATSDISITITTDGTHLSGIVIEYSNGLISTQINTSYTYENLVRDAQ